jgi:kinesin family protein 15
LNVAETHSTLKFAQRAKLIKNKAVINEDSSGTILLLKNEIKKLKKELADQHKLMNVLETEKNVLTRSIQAFSQENNNGAVS